MWIDCMTTYIGSRQQCEVPPIKRENSRVR